MQIADCRLRIAELEEEQRAKSGARNSALRNPNSAFTLMELLIVITIISILAGLVLSGLASAVNDARVARTRAQINKIDSLIMERYESYRTRPVRVPPSANTLVAAQNRLAALRELMRLEMPDQIADICTDLELTDVNDGSLAAFTSLTDAKRAVLAIVPSVTKSYKRLAHRNSISQGKEWSTANQGSECLYLILSTMKDGDKSAIEFFTPDEIGDTDEDGMKEILDGFGRPILFIRWAPGYIIQNGVVTLQTSDATAAPDPFDPLRVDPRFADMDTTNDSFYLKPLILSAGLDKGYDTAAVPNWDHAVVVTAPHPANDPYYRAAGVLPGAPLAGGEWADNITNHFIEPQ